LPGAHLQRKPGKPGFSDFVWRSFRLEIRAHFSLKTARMLLPRYRHKSHIRALDMTVNDFARYMPPHGQTTKLVYLCP
jgi:hypothetical protein